MILSDDHRSNGHQMDVPGMDGNETAPRAATSTLDEQRELRELQEKYAYLSADFSTFRRRTAQELRTAVLQGQAKVLRDLVGIYDDVTRAYETLAQQMAAHADEKGAASLAGIALVQKNCEKILQQHGAVKINQLTMFDPTIHEALMQVPASSGFPVGTIVEVFEQGYMYHDILLRPARVSVAHEA